MIKKRGTDSVGCSAPPGGTGEGANTRLLDRSLASLKEVVKLVARVKHPYTFRAFRTLSFLLYMQTPSLARQSDGTLEITSITEFSLRAHLANSKYIRDDLRILLKLGLLETLTLGHNRATLRVKLPPGMSWSTL